MKQKIRNQNKFIIYLLYGTKALQGPSPTTQ